MKESLTSTLPSGIYQIRNTYNQKVYVGRASNLIKRKSAHFSALKFNKHTNPHLQSSYNLVGKDYFVFEVLEYCSKDDLILLEDKWCKLLKSHLGDFGYNLALTGGDKEFIGHSEDTKRKMSLSQKGRKVSDRTKKLISEKLTGRVHTETTKNKIRYWHATHTHPMYGRYHTLEAKQKISDKQKGKPSHNRRKVKAIIQAVKEEILFNSVIEASIYFEVLNTSIQNNLKNKSKLVNTNKGKVKFHYV